MDTERETFVDYAIEYAAKGWKPYPIQPPNGKGCSCRKGEDCGDPGKHPYHDLGGLASATRDKRKLKTLFGSSDASIGLLCDRFWALDVEADGIDDLAKLIEENGDLPITPKSLTGGKGRHYLFKADPRIKKSPTKIGGLAIDVRAGKTSAIVAPPSRHHSGREYAWLVDPSEVEIAKAPQWLIDFVLQKKQSKFTFDGDLDLADHPGVSEGDRNEILCRLVGAHLAKHGETPDLLRLALQWNQRCDPPKKEDAIKKPVAYLVAKHLRNNPQEDEAEEKEESSELTIRSFSEIERKPIRWLWKGRLALGKMMLLNGESAVGKSILTVDVAARISRGIDFPDGSLCPLGDVFFIAGEDGCEDTIGPRLDAAGADVDRVHHLQGPRPKGEKYASPIDLSRHIAKLDRMLSQYPEAKLIVLDPILEFLGEKANSDKATDVRRVLAPLRTVIEEHDVAVVMMNHLAKHGRNAKTRGLGSGAFQQLSRLEFRVIEDREDPERRFFIPVTRNIGNAPGLAYRIRPWNQDEDIGYAEWEKGTIDISLEEAEQVDDDDRSAIDEAIEWLTIFLSEGKIEAKLGLKESKANGIANKTLRRAMKKVDVKPYQSDRRWWWELPETSSEDSPEGDSRFTF